MLVVSFISIIGPSVMLSHPCVVGTYEIKSVLILLIWESILSVKIENLSLVLVTNLTRTN